jgi:hypothetical protein
VNGSIFSFTKYIQLKLDENKTTLNLDAVYYGDQERIPVGRAACVDSGEKATEYSGAPRRVTIQMTTYIMIYTSMVRSSQENREADDQIAEAVETLLHQSEDFEGQVNVDTLVTGVEYGYALRDKTLFRTARLTVAGRDQVQLPSSI